MGGRHRQVAGAQLTRARKALHAVPPGALAVALPLALLAGAGPVAGALSGNDAHPAIPPVPSTPFTRPASDTDPSRALGLTTFPTGSGLPGGATPSGGTVTPPGGSSSAASEAPGVPGRAFTAYRTAAALLGAAAPGCHLSWPVLAGIGAVESGHGTYGGARVGADGIARPTILGPRLDGSAGTAYVRDTDGGRWDGDAVVDRAVGPMQFIPGTWQVVGVDADHDGTANPSDIDDAAASAGRYLCAGGRDLATPQGLRAALLSYNHSPAYADLVEHFIAAYASGTAPVGLASGTAPVGLASGSGGGSPAGSAPQTARPSASPEPASPATRPSTAPSRRPAPAEPSQSPPAPKPSASASPATSSAAAADVVGTVSGVVGTITGASPSGSPSAPATAAPTPTSGTDVLGPLGSSVGSPVGSSVGEVVQGSTCTVGGLLGATPSC